MLSSTCGNAVGDQLKSFRFTDILESVLEFTGSPTVIKIEGSKIDDVTDWFTISNSGQTITATLNDAYYNDADMNSKFTLHFNAKIKDGADFSKYKNGDYYVIPNYGTIRIKQKGYDAKTLDSDPVNVYVPLAELTLDKVADTYEYEVGDTVTYTITAKNVSSNPAWLNVLTDPIPSDLKITSVETSSTVLH